MVLLDEYMFKSVTGNLNCHPSSYRKYFGSMHPLKLDKHKILFISRVTIWSFLKSGLKYRPAIFFK